MESGIWRELHDDVEAALFAVQDLGGDKFDGDPRIKSIVATKLEEALLWIKRGAERGAA